MFTKVLIFSVVAAVALAIDYPPGVHPAVCPNYPICDASVLMRHTLDGTPIPEWAMPFPYAFSRLFPFGLKPEDLATRYPADVDPVLCPNYPFCK